jgi:hypothetical protein
VVQAVTEAFRVRILLVVLLFVAVIGATYFVLENIEPMPEPPRPATPAGANGDDGTGGAGEMVGATEPTEQPEPEALSLETDVRVLMLARHPRSMNTHLIQQWDVSPRISHTVWFQRPPATDGAGQGATLVDPPGAERLADADVLVLHDIDPASFSADFWGVVRRRVEDGTMGLLVMPEVEGGPAMLAHPVLGDVLPVAKAHPIQGQSIPGMFGDDARPLVVEAAGTTHPATRLVRWARWSERIWTDLQNGPRAWRVRMCYPVEEVKPGATVLMRCEPRRGPSIPAVIEGNPRKGRVLWIGVGEFGEASWRDSVSYRRLTVLTYNVVAWLSGQTQ